MTKAHAASATLVILNVVVLGVVLTQGNPVRAQEHSQILRTQRLELMDAAGRVRASFRIDGDEAVLRFLDETGDIRVKLAAGANGSGLLLLDEAGQPGVQIIARRAPAGARLLTTSINLTGADGQPHVITP